MNNLDIAGHAGYVSIACGLYLLSIGYKSGWLCRFAGEILWTVIGVKMEMTSIWGWGIVFMLIDIKGYIKWLKSERNQLKLKGEIFRTMSETNY